MLLNGEGSRLFQLHTSRPGGGVVYLPDAESIEPPTPPEFLLGCLPEDVREDAIAYCQSIGPYSALMAMEAGVEELEWREPLQELEGNLVSEDVFGTLVEVFGDGVESLGTVDLWFGSRGRRRRYHAVRFGPGWPARPTDSFAELARTAELVVKAECLPPLDRDYASVGGEISASAKDGPLELAFPSWLDRDDRMIRINRAVVTEGLVKRWRATETSRYLQGDNSEHDLWFTETVGGFDLRDRAITYRWVEAPVPDWVDGM